MTTPEGSRVWVSEDRYGDDHHIGYATITRGAREGMVEVQFDPVYISADRITPRKARGTVTTSGHKTRQESLDDGPRGEG